MTIYGSRAKAAFSSLGMRPIEILEGKEEPVRLDKVVEDLREDEEVETALEPLVRKYFDVLDEKGIVEYDSSGDLFDPRNKSLHKNGYSNEDIQSFVESFDRDY